MFEEPMLDFELDDEDIMVEGADTRGEALKHVFNLNPVSKTEESNNGGPYSRNFMQKI